MSTANRNNKGLLSSEDYSISIPLHTKTISKAKVYKIIEKKTTTYPMVTSVIYGSRNASPVFEILSVSVNTTNAKSLANSVFNLYKDDSCIYIQIASFSTVSIIFETPSSSEVELQLTESDVNVEELTKIL